MPTPQLEIIGWSTSRTGPYHDFNGPAHLVLDRNGIAVAACGTRAMLSGQAHKDPPDYARGICHSCARIYQTRYHEAPNGR